MSDNINILGEENPLDEKLCNIKVVPIVALKKKFSVSSHDAKIPFYFIWKDLNLQVTLPIMKKTVKKILNNVSGYTQSSQITAIMGPSGSGKTSLLNTLSNRISYPKNSTHSTTFYLNNLQISKTFMSKNSSYVQQDDILYDVLNPYEAFFFAYKLRYNYTDEQTHERVNDLLEELQLKSCEKVEIGNYFKKGLSGGQKKRVSAGLEIITNAKIMFLDEPTSGLDSNTSYILIDILKKMAIRREMNIIITIHQPSSNIFNLFDKLILLNAGETIYQGPILDTIQYFNENVEKLNERSNPADALMHLIEIKNSIKQGDMFTKCYDTHISKEIDIHIEQIKRSSNVRQEELEAMFKKTQSRAGYFTTQKMLLWRTWAGFKRDTDKLLMEIFARVWFIFLIISIFQLTDDSVGAQSRASFCYHFVLAIYMLQVYGSIVSFPKERAIVFREKSSNMYRIFPYYLSKNLIETPISLIITIIFAITIYWSVGLRTDSFKYAFNYFIIAMVTSYFAGSVGYFLGAFFENTGIAMILLTVTTIGFQLFSGFLVSRNNMPPVINLIRYVSPFYYSIMALMQNEFDDNPKIPPGMNMATNIGLDEFSVWVCILIMFIYSTGLRILGYFSLTFNSRK